MNVWRRTVNSRRPDRGCSRLPRHLISSRLPYLWVGVNLYSTERDHVSNTRSRPGKHASDAWSRPGSRMQSSCPPPLASAAPVDTGNPQPCHVSIHCRTKEAHTRQSRPDSGLAKVLIFLNGDPSLLGSGIPGLLASAVPVGRTGLVTSDCQRMNLWRRIVNL